MSKYDSITTAKDLLYEVKAHGLSLKQEDINRVADIFGHESVEELHRLANDIGRNNINGEPDPKGSWSSTRHPTQNLFYTVISQIWHWEEVTRFWNQHTNPEYEELLKLRAEVKELRNSIEYQKAQKELEHNRAIEAEFAKSASEESVRKLETEVYWLKMSEIELKAKLYDMMMVAEKEK